MFGVSEGKSMAEGDADVKGGSGRESGEEVDDMFMA